MTALIRQIVDHLEKIDWLMDSIRQLSLTQERHGYDPERILTPERRQCVADCIQTTEKLLEEYRDSMDIYRDMAKDLSELLQPMYGSGTITVEDYMALEFDVEGYEEEDGEEDLSSLLYVVTRLDTCTQELNAVLVELGYRV